LNIFNILETLFSCSNGVAQCGFCWLEYKGYVFYTFPNLGSVVISAIMDFVDDCTVTLWSFYTSGIFRVCSYSNFWFYHEFGKFLGGARRINNFVGGPR